MLMVSLNIILLAFFIFLNSIAVIDQKKKMLALGSLLHGFGLYGGGLAIIGSKQEAKGVGPPSAPIQEVQDIQVIELKRLVLFSRLEDKVAVIPRRDEKVIIIPDEVLFSPDSHQIKREAYPFLKKICEAVGDSNYPVRIEGHTDDVPPQNETFSSNWELSQLKALNILRFFIDAGNLSPDRLSAFGYSEYRPIVLNDSRENRAKNRRIEIVLDTRERADAENVIGFKRPPAFFRFKDFVFGVLRKRPW